MDFTQRNEPPVERQHRAGLETRPAVVEHKLLPAEEHIHDHAEDEDPRRPERNGEEKTEEPGLLDDHAGEEHATHGPADEPQDQEATAAPLRIAASQLKPLPGPLEGGLSACAAVPVILNQVGPSGSSLPTGHDFNSLRVPCTLRQRQRQRLPTASRREQLTST